MIRTAKVVLYACVVMASLFFIVVEIGSFFVNQ